MNILEKRKFLKNKIFSLQDEVSRILSIDDDGDIYVADRDNDRVVVYDRDGKYVTLFTGDATLSKIGKTYIMSSPRVLRLREMSNREIWRKLRAPASVRTYGNLIYIPDFGCHRIQVYEKESYPLTKDEIFEQPNHPCLLYTSPSPRDRTRSRMPSSA